MTLPMYAILGLFSLVCYLLSFRAITLRRQAEELRRERDRWRTQGLAVISQAKLDSMQEMISEQQETIYELARQIRQARRAKFRVRAYTVAGARPQNYRMN